MRVRWSYRSQTRGSFVQIEPLWIELIDHFNFVPSYFPFEKFLIRDFFDNRFETFVIDKLELLVTRCEIPWITAGFVFVNSGMNVSRHTNV